MTWAANTNALDSLVSNSTINLGKVENAQRDNLKWKVAITKDGRMPGAGFIPLCIQWLEDVHPSMAMPTLGCSFKSLTLYHSKANWLTGALTTIGCNELVTIKTSHENETAFMKLNILCPHGEVILPSKL